MACTFVNLHLHTEMGSPLDGFCRIPDVIKRSKELNYDSIAITDHGSMSAILPLYDEGKEHGIKVIPGIEVYCVDDRTVRVRGETNRHLVLLAKNKQGYQNLLKLNFEAYQTGSVSVYDRVVPRVDLGLLSKYGKGVIASSACIVGTIPYLLNQKKESEAITLAETYKEIFDDFYLEVQPSHLIGEDQKRTNKNIKDLSKKLDIPIIVTLDSHYVYAEDREFHHVLLAIQSKKTIYDEKRLKFEANPLMSEEDLLKEFPKEYIENTRKIADQCEPATYLESKEGYKIPPFPIPDDQEFDKYYQKAKEKGIDKDRVAIYLRYKIQQGWEKNLSKLFKKYPEKRLRYRARLKKELEVIENMNFTEYFLIVADMLEECGKRGIPRGVGRGSAAGCLLSFLLDITRVDPIKYGLLFERFLNKERISMPDIDSDICQSRRDEVKQYLVEKYGEDKVASIATFGTMKVRACIKDVVRSLELGGNKSESFRLADKISKSVPDDNPDVTFEEAYENSEEFQAYCEMDLPKPKGAKLKDALIKFEGITRQMGIHAAGVIISTDPLIETVPVIVQKDIVATAYDGPTLEDAGYLKLDVLGLKSLDVIEMAIENARHIKGQDAISGFRLTGLEYNPQDPHAISKLRAAFVAETDESIKMATRTYNLYRSGKTSACFQVSGNGMQNLLRNVKPNEIEDIAAVLALFRPGPLGSGMTQDYADRKNGRKKVEYPHLDLEPILDKTYGVLCLEEHTPIYCVDFNRYIPIKECVSGMKIQSLDEHGKAIISSIKGIINKGKKKVCSYVLSNGIELILTKDHEVYTPYGWMEIEKAYKKQLLVAVPSKLISSKSKSKDENRLRILAYLLTDGALTQGANVSYISKDEGLKLAYEKAILETFPRVKTYRRLGRTKGVEEIAAAKKEDCYSDSDIRLNYIPNDLLIWLRDLGLKDKDGGCNSYTKFVPEEFLQLNVEDTAKFVAFMWDGDGGIDPNFYFYTTCSKKLAAHVFLLLQRLGLAPNLHVRKDKAYSVISYMVEDCQEKFGKHMTSIKKEKSLRKKTGGQQSIKGFFMKSFLKEKVITHLRQKGISQTNFAQNLGINRGNLFRPHNYCKRSLADKVQTVIEDSELSLLLTDDIFWLPIKRREGVGIRTVYDLVIDKKTPNFIANGMYVHNCYQEQVMKIATDIGGFTMSQADTLRKAVGKKIKKLMESQVVKFKEGALKKGYTQELADYLWDLILKFASYGFNKSHSVSYALTSYKMAFLKANFPAAFWAAALSLEGNEIKKTSYMSEIGTTRNSKSYVKLLPVDINKSKKVFVCENEHEIRRDLTSLKGLGIAAVNEIVEKAPFDSIIDFFDRVDTKKINARVVKVLIRAGAFNFFGLSRKMLEYAFADGRSKLNAYKKRHEVKTVKDSSFMYDWDQGLEEVVKKAQTADPKFVYGEPEWTDEEIRKLEEEIYGMPISSHVMDPFKNEELAIAGERSYLNLGADFDGLQEGQVVKVMTLIKSKKQEIKCKNGKILRNYNIEDRDGSAELAVFEEEHRKHQNELKVGNIIQIVATVTKRFGAFKKLTFLSGRRGNGMIKCLFYKKK